MVYVNCTNDAREALINCIKNKFEDIGCPWLFDMVDWAKCNQIHLDEIRKFSELSGSMLHPLIFVLVSLIITIIVYIVLSYLKIQILLIYIIFSFAGIFAFAAIYIAYYYANTVHYRIKNYLRNNLLLIMMH